MKSLIWATILICLLAACSINPSSSDIPQEINSAPVVVSASPTSSFVGPKLLKGSNLNQALSIIPVDANHVEFTDWALIKKNEGFESLSSADDMDKRKDFYLAIAGKYATPSFFGLRGLENHSQLWGWDSTDLEWEIRSSINLSPNYALKFRENFNFAPVIASLKAHGFKEENYQGITIYTTPLDNAVEWIGTTELSITNTAVIEEANLLVMSIDHDTLLLMIEVFQNKADSLADKESVQELIPQLDNTPGAFISSNVCSLLSSQALLDRLASDPVADIKQVRLQLESRPQLESYEILGIGYRINGSEPVGRIVLQFSDPEKASKDLKPRQRLAQTGITRGKNPQPYEEIFFSLSNDPKVQGNQIVMEVVPAKNRILGLFAMIRHFDINFATCP